LYERLKYRKPLRLRGFETLYCSGESYSPESHEQLILNDKSFQENYEEFKKNVIDNIGRKYFPIYRMADGEFKLCLQNRQGRRFSSCFAAFYKNLKAIIKAGNMYSRKVPRNLFERIINIFDDNYFYVAHGEAYNGKEQKKLIKKFINDVKEISNEGLLAIHFVDWLEGDSYQNMIEPMCRWFDEHDIVLTGANYTSFYYVYAILTGPDRVHLFKNRNILIISSINQERKQKITEQLIEVEEVNCVEFYEISPNKSMFDKISVEKIREKPDLVLVAAGVGSANILTQLKPLDTVCIDVGIVVETFSNLSLKNNRIFLKPTSI
jgi:hypothetical protein